MNPELEKYVNAAHNLHSLYSEANVVISKCVSRWNGFSGTSSIAPEMSLDVHELPMISFRLLITNIAEVFRNLLYTDPTQFWTGGQKDICLKRFMPLHQETQKLKRKLERITGMISGQMKVLTPLLISYSDESFFLSGICNNADFNRSSIDKQSSEVEREVLKMMASGIMNGATSKKMGILSRMKAAVLCGSMSSKKARILKTFQARLQEIEEEEKKLQDSNKAFASVEDVSWEPEKFMATWSEEGGSGEQSVTFDRERTIAEIVSKANAKYFPNQSSTEEQKDADVLNENLNGNEVTVLHHPPTPFSPCSSDLSAQEENVSLPGVVSPEFPQDPLANFKILVKDARDGVAWITSSIRAAETQFYAPPESLVKGSGSFLELKDFVDIVEEAGIGLQVKIARNERKGKSNFSIEQLDLMKSLGKVYLVGECLLAQLESLTGLVQTGAGDLKGIISEYRPGEDSEDELVLPVADVKRCHQLEMLFSNASQKDGFSDV